MKVKVRKKQMGALLCALSLLLNTSCYTINLNKTRVRHEHRIEKANERSKATLSQVEAVAFQKNALTLSLKHYPLIQFTQKDHYIKGKPFDAGNFGSTTLGYGLLFLLTSAILFVPSKGRKSSALSASTLPAFSAMFGAFMTGDFLISLFQHIPQTTVKTSQKTEPRKSLAAPTPRQSVALVYQGKTIYKTQTDHHGHFTLPLSSLLDSQLGFNEDQDLRVQLPGSQHSSLKFNLAQLNTHHLKAYQGFVDDQNKAASVLILPPVSDSEMRSMTDLKKSPFLFYAQKKRINQLLALGHQNKTQKILNYLKAKDYSLAASEVNRSAPASSIYKRFKSQVPSWIKKGHEKTFKIAYSEAVRGDYENAARILKDNIPSHSHLYLKAQRKQKLWSGIVASRIAAKKKAHAEKSNKVQIVAGSDILSNSYKADDYSKMKYKGGGKYTITHHKGQTYTDYRNSVQIKIINHNNVGVAFKFWASQKYTLNLPIVGSRSEYIRQCGTNPAKQIYLKAKGSWSTSCTVGLNNGIFERSPLHYGIKDLVFDK